MNGGEDLNDEEKGIVEEFLEEYGEGFSEEDVNEFFLRVGGEKDGIELLARYARGVLGGGGKVVRARKKRLVSRGRFVFVVRDHHRWCRVSLPADCRFVDLRELIEEAMCLSGGWFEVREEGEVLEFSNRDEAYCEEENGIAALFDEGVRGFYFRVQGSEFMVLIEAIVEAGRGGTSEALYGVVHEVGGGDQA